jgi:hypothetical protein
MILFRDPHFVSPVGGLDKRSTHRYTALLPSQHTFNATIPNAG